MGYISICWISYGLRASVTQHQNHENNRFLIIITIMKMAASVIPIALLSNYVYADCSVSDVTCIIPACALWLTDNSYPKKRLSL